MHRHAVGDEPGREDPDAAENQSELGEDLGAERHQECERVGSERPPYDRGHAVDAERGADLALGNRGHESGGHVRQGEQRRRRSEEDHRQPGQARGGERHDEQREPRRHRHCRQPQRDRDEPQLEPFQQVVRPSGPTPEGPSSCRRGPRRAARPRYPNTMKRPARPRAAAAGSSRMPRPSPTRWRCRTRLTTVGSRSNDRDDLQERARPAPAPPRRGAGTDMRSSRRRRSRLTVRTVSGKVSGCIRGKCSDAARRGIRREPGPGTAPVGPVARRDRRRRGGCEWR